MKLLGDFFTILSSNVSDEMLTVFGVLNAKHIVYKAHFPGHPVTPGVIQLKLVHELLENHLDKKLALKELIQSKFIRVIDPTIIPNLTLEIKIGLTRPMVVKAVGKFEDETLFRMHARFEAKE